MIAQHGTIDHREATRLAAASVDTTLEPGERVALDAHLRACVACRAAAAAFADDARTLRVLDFGDGPARTRARVALHAGKALPRGSGVGRRSVLLATALLLIAATGTAIVGGVGARPGTPARPAVSDAPSLAPRIVLGTEVVTLAAQELWVEAGGRRFRGTGAVRVSSDPGTPTYRTLELAWSEHGVEMRLYLYFGGDQRWWWVDEVRTYNGQQPGEWLVAKGRFFQSPLGQPWTGDIDLTLHDAGGAGGGPATLHVRGGILAVNPFDGVNRPLGGGIKLRENIDQLFEPGAALHCSGIPQMHPRDAEQVLLALGYKLSWRLIRDIRGNESYWEIRREAPDGYLAVNTYGTMVGGEGELILPVVAPGEPGPPPATAPREEDCPKGTAEPTG